MLSGMPVTLKSNIYDSDSQFFTSIGIFILQYDMLGFLVKHPKNDRKELAV
jgi:hypothetical protein